MTFLADRDLELYIKKKSREGMWAILISLPGIALLGAGFYFHTSSVFEFVGTTSVVVAIFGGFVYSSSFKTGKIINLMISGIVIEEDSIRITTFPYSFFFTTYPPIEKVIANRNLDFFDVDFPLYKKELTSNDSLGINIEETKYYLLYKHYPNELLQQFNRMKNYETANH